MCLGSFPRVCTYESIVPNRLSNVRNLPLDLNDGKRMSLSPDNKRSGMAATAGSPVNNPLLGGLGGGGLQKKGMGGQSSVG